jgi:hypothetical protein
MLADERRAPDLSSAQLCSGMSMARAETECRRALEVSCRALM